jgi:hypothetical protein
MNFAGPHGTCFVYNVRPGCGSAIANYSIYPSEDEVLLRPYCRYVVENVVPGAVVMSVLPP